MSRQDYATPLCLIEAVERRFGPIVHDLAATSRVTFVGEPAPFNRDLMLCAWGEGLVGFVPWVWR